MEYRLKYRDVPWSVAFGVLPGKIIGTFLIKPVEKFKRNWEVILHKWLTRLLIIVLLAMMVVAVWALFDHLTAGKFTKDLIRLWDSFIGLFMNSPDAEAPL